MAEEQTFRDGRRRCPECGAEVVETRYGCWLCGHEFHPGATEPRPKVSNIDLPVAVSVEAEERRMQWQFSLSTVLLWTAWIAVVLGVVMIAPGLAAVLAVLTVPAGMATILSAERHRKRKGEPMSLVDGIGLFFSYFATTLGAVLMGLVAAAGAFFAACTVALFGFNGDFESEHFWWILVAIASIAGLIAAIFAAVKFTRR